MQWRCVVVPAHDKPQAATWPKATAMAMVQRTCESNSGRRTVGTRYYITSMEDPRADVVLAAVRSHWRVENQVHWTMDVIFHEDACAARAANAVAIVGALRRAAFNLLRQAKTRDVSMRSLRRMAAMNPDVMLQILMGRTPSVNPNPPAAPGRGCEPGWRGPLGGLWRLSAGHAGVRGELSRQV